MALRIELSAAKNKMAEMEEQLQEYDDRFACSEDKTARRKMEADADADYEETPFRRRFGAGCVHWHFVLDASIWILRYDRWCFLFKIMSLFLTLGGRRGRK